jgi:superkiller protein 3
MAQTIDPECISAWAGRALIAARTDAEHSLQLFEHALDLSTACHPVLVYGVAQQWLKLTAMHGYASSHVSVPLFALRKHLERQPKDTTAWNLYSLLLEWCELHDRALQANDAALAGQDASTSVMQQALLENRGRLLCASHAFADAVGVLEQLDLSSHTAIGFVVRGIAYFFNRQLETSLEMFEHALAAAGEHEREHARVVLCVAQVLWALGTAEHRALAKQQLFSM